MDKISLEEIKPHDRVALDYRSQSEDFKVVALWRGGVVINWEEEKGWSISSRITDDGMQELYDQAIEDGTITPQEARRELFWYVSLSNITRIIRRNKIKWID